MKLGSIARAIASVCGSTLIDVETGKPLGKAFVCCWRGRIHVIGYTGEASLRPVAIPDPHLTYCKITLGFTAPSEPNFPKIR
jgi:hypothetical protein